MTKQPSETHGTQADTGARVPRLRQTHTNIITYMGF